MPYDNNGVILPTMYRSHYISQLTPEMDGKEVVLGGWVHEVRNIGKIVFILLRDHSGIVQVIGKDGVVPDEVVKAMSLPKESVIMVRGRVKRSGGKIMRNPVFIYADSSLDGASRIMIEHGIGRVPVVEDKLTMICIGMLTSTDIVKAAKKA